MPFTYTPEQRAKAIAKVIAGLQIGKPLTVICGEEGMPEDDTIRDWGEQDPVVGRAIARARARGFDVIAMEAQAIQDEPPAMHYTEWGPKIDPAGVAHQKNRFEAKLKLLAKWDPKRYGDLLKLGGSDGGDLRITVSAEDAGA